MKRVKTNIPGLDKLIEGGIPEGFNVLVMGKPGTGKSILALQYLYNGVAMGENGIYVSLDVNADELIEQGRQFGMDIEKAMQDKKLTILEIPLNKQTRINLFKLIEDQIKEKRAKRLVFDSLSSFLFNINQFIMQVPIDNLPKLSYDLSSYTEEEMMYHQELSTSMEKVRPDPRYYKAVSSEKRELYLAMRELSMFGTTNMLINSSSSNNIDASIDGVSEFASDGLIKLMMSSVGDTVNRTIEVTKMRKTKIDATKHNFEFNANGIILEE